MCSVSAVVPRQSLALPLIEPSRSIATIFSRHDHPICRCSFPLADLRRYGKAIDLAGNFVIADQGDCQSILKPIVEQHNGVLRERCKERGGASEEIKVKVAQEIISKSKAKGISPVRYLAEAESGEGQENIWKLAIAGIYTDYEAALRASNTLDFDDLLVFG